MSSAGTRERKLPVRVSIPGIHTKLGGSSPGKDTVVAEGKQITVSESHKRDPKTGHYYEGGPFYTSRITYWIHPGSVRDATDGINYYTGPVSGVFPTLEERTKLQSPNPNLNFGSKSITNEKQDGSTAIALASPINPASTLGVGLSETYREGLPSLPGVQTWRDRTRALRGASGEFLNTVFGWLPLKNEVEEVAAAARHHRDILNQYHHGEGRNTHRRFDFPSSKTISNRPPVDEWPLFLGPINSNVIYGGLSSKRNVSLVRETKKWFEGCFTYALPSSTESWRRAVGFGSDADALYGIALNPEVLWELTPWSWAVDWFSNAGFLIKNVRNFELAGQVMRYGYLMEETIERYTAVVDRCPFRTRNAAGKEESTLSTPSACGIEVVTKRRSPANPFGFGISWQGLSPVQLAITAALGISRTL